MSSLPLYRARVDFNGQTAVVPFSGTPSLASLKALVCGAFPSLSSAVFDLYISDGQRHVTFVSGSDLAKAIIQQAAGELSSPSSWASRLQQSVIAAIRPEESVSLPRCGQASGELFSSLIKSEVAERRPEITSVVQRTIQDSLVDGESGWEIVQSRTCSICAARPIVGPIYICSQCTGEPKVVLCGDCEAKGLHSQHALLKVRNEQQLSETVRSLLGASEVRSEICSYVSEERKSAAPPAPQVARSVAKFEPEKKKPMTAIFSAMKSAGRWINNVLFKKYPSKMLVPLDSCYEREVAVEPGSTAFAYWNVINCSKKSWPSPLFVHLSSPGLVLESVSFPKVSVASGELFDFAIPISAPANEGVYRVKVSVTDTFATKIGRGLTVVLNVKKVDRPAAGKT